MKNEILSLIQSIVPNAFVIVQDKKTFYGSEYLKIVIAGSDKLINNVQGQYPGLVSLSLDLKTLELEVQGYGGCGGQYVLIKPDKNNPRERNLVYGSVKVPFRKPKGEVKNVLAAIGKFAENWKRIIGENLDRMPHNELVDWSAVVK